MHFYDAIRHLGREVLLSICYQLVRGELGLEAILGAEPEMWVRLQAEHDLYIARKKRDAA